MSETGYIKHYRSFKADWLQENHPNAFLLLTLIARRAARSKDNLDGFQPGECHIGDHQAAGLTRQQYRTALKFLADNKFIRIIVTCRSRKTSTTDQPPKAQKSTTVSSTVGTKVKLLDSDIYDPNINESNHRSGHRDTKKAQKINHEQEDKKRNKQEVILKQQHTLAIDVSKPSHPKLVVVVDKQKSLNGVHMGIQYVNTKGQEQFVSDQDIFHRFIKSSYSTKQIQDAIEKAKLNTSPINDIFKYLEGIIKISLQQPQKTKKKLSKTENAPPKNTEPLVSGSIYFKEIK